MYCFFDLFLYSYAVFIDVTWEKKSGWIFTGAFAGFVGGMLGLGDGFIIAPILMMMGYKTKEAATTTAFVVTFSSFSGYLGHMVQGEMNWLLTGIVVLVWY